MLPARVNQHVAILRPDPKKLASRFLKYYLLNPNFKNFMLGMSSVGGTRNALTKGMIESFDIDHPSLPTQIRIAAILSALDDKIELNRQTNVTLEAIAQAIFKEWFVNFRFPGATGDMQDSELGPIPKGWENSTLKNLTVKIGSGATPRGGSGVYLDEGIALIRSQNVYDSEFVWEGLARISDESAELLRNVEVEQDDVLLNITSASILRTCMVDPQVLPARVNQHVAIIRANPGIPSRYIHLYLLQQKTKTYLMGLNAGGSREAVTKGHIESVPILNPPFNLLQCFNTFTTPIYSEVEQLSYQSRILSSIRDTLLPNLMNGQISVGPDDGVNEKGYHFPPLQSPQSFGASKTIGPVTKKSSATVESDESDVRRLKIFAPFQNHRTVRREGKN